MSTLIHNFRTSLDAKVCTEIFTYIIVVFILVKLSMDELGPDVRRFRRFPPSSWLYLASTLFWPVTIGSFAGLLILGLLHVALDKAENLEMGALVPSWLESVSCDDAGSNFGGLQTELALRELVAALKQECGLTPDRWGCAS